VRSPQDVAPRVPRTRHRGRWWLLGGAIVLIILLASLRSLATLYTDRLWFSSVNLTSVWDTLLGIKLGLFASFGGLFFVLLWVNLIVCDRISSVVDSTDPEDELVRRYQRVVRPYANRIYAGLSVIVALIAAAGTIGEWQNWLLFTHGVNFDWTDPQFSKNAGFYVFKLPFLEFLVNWLIVSLIVILIFTAIFHYLNGGIRTQRTTRPRVRPVVKAHLSVLLAVIALAKAAGYLLAKYQLVTSTNSFVEGAGYTDVHARIPAFNLLFWISLAAAAVLLWNIRRQGWTLPVLAVGLWAFVALVIGVIYPAIAQAIVNPSQNQKEAPYISRNIAATRYAYDLNDVKVSSFPADTTLSALSVLKNMPTLDNIRLWDPDSQISLPTFNKLQYQHGYYTFQGVAVDRYKINGVLQPVLVGVRQINESGIQSPTWVNTHLQYTHGEGIVIAQADAANSSGDPVFRVRDVPSVSSNGLPKVTQPEVYFGLNEPGYVVANTKEVEIGGQPHYKGTGGVQLSSFLRKAAFALRLGDFNLLISGQVTHQSRIMFVRDIQQMAQKAAPFLSWDADPYAVLVKGKIYWILDGYTTTANFPYSQNASTATVPQGSGLPGSYNYVRNSVKLVINAYSGSMKFYAMDNDPILRTYESAFPGMFTPGADMPKALQNHLRYPEDMFSIQAALYGRYRLSSPLNFYNANGAWTLSPTAGAGPVSEGALKVTLTTNAQGQVISGSVAPQSPIYQVVALPGTTKETFTISDAYVPFNNGAASQNLSALVFGTYTDGAGGTLHVYEADGSQDVGPALADTEIQQNQTVSSKITLLDQLGSSVLLGNTLAVPVGNSVIYVRPLYLEASGNPEPELQDVITVLGTDVQMAPTVGQSLSQLLSAPISSGTGGTTSSPSSLAAAAAQQVSSLIAQAQADYNAAQTALKSGSSTSLSTYQSDISAMEQVLNEADTILKAAGATPTTTTTTTTLPSSKVKVKPKTKTKSSTALGGHAPALGS
jgi:uncharacterized protein